MKDIAGRVPVDTLAAIVTQPGPEWVPRKKISQAHWEACPSMSDPPSDVKDWRGAKLGRFVVVGFWSRGRKGGMSRWVVRCVCGRYETRRAWSIRRPDPKDCCQYCRHLEHLKREDYHRQHGRWPE